MLPVPFHPSLHTFACILSPALRLRNPSYRIFRYPARPNTVFLTIWGISHVLLSFLNAVTCPPRLLRTVSGYKVPFRTNTPLAAPMAPHFETVKVRLPVLSPVITRDNMSLRENTSLSRGHYDAEAGVHMEEFLHLFGAAVFVQADIKSNIPVFIQTPILMSATDSSAVLRVCVQKTTLLAAHSGVPAVVHKG
ncbi:hypothetical protein B0H11DRAFT_2258554 [Mycena galericulata]|nr:hypothetical protein B0H11DRAFT_2258554 [Mycena galericulata]